MVKRWGRVDENNMIVEFTYENPEGRFHPDLIWVEVDHDTKWGTKLTVFGSEQKYELPIVEPDLNAMFYEAQKVREDDLNKRETKRTEDPEISQYTLNSVPTR